VECVIVGEACGFIGVLFVHTLEEWQKDLANNDWTARDPVAPSGSCSFFVPLRVEQLSRDFRIN